MKNIRTIISVVVMAALLLLYIGFAGYQALLMIATGEPLAVIFGIALWVAPIIGVWSIVREITFGIEAQALLNRFKAEFGEPRLPVVDRRDSVEVEKLHTENPKTWQESLIHGLTLDTIGKRREARISVRKAISLAKVNSPT